MQRQSGATTSLESDGLPVVPARGRSVLAALAILLLAAIAQADTGWPGGVWEPGPETYDMTVVSGVEVVMDDGVILHASVGYPADPGTGLRAEGEFPVLLTQNPYVGGENPDPFFVSRGYIFAVAEVRGTLESELSASDPDGPLANDFRGVRSGLDGAVLVDWAADLDGSNGRVGLYGCSWLGINQFLTAGELDKPSPVKAMVPACYDQAYHSFILGGVPSATVLFFDNFLAQFRSGAKHAAENAAAGAVIKNDILAGGDRAYDRDWWQERTVDARAETVVENNIPTLLWTGWQALEAITGGVDVYSALQNAKKNRATYGPMRVRPNSSVGKFQIIVGPGGHGQGLDKSLELLWYDTWVKEQETGIEETGTGMHLYELGGNRWVNQASWPITDEYTPFYLSDSGLASAPVAHTAEVAFGDPELQPGTTASYDSAPLAADQTIAGPIAATLHVRSSNTNAHFVVSLYDVAPDDSAAEVARGNLIGSGRELDPERSWYDANGLAIKPEGTYLDFDPMTPGELYRLDIELFPTLRRIAAGHRLRVVVSTTVAQSTCASILSLLNPYPCVFNAVQLPTLFGGIYEIVSDPSNPSSLNVPLVDPASLTTAESGLTPTSPGQTQPLDWGPSD